MPRNAAAYRVVAASLALLGRTDEAPEAIRVLLTSTPNATMGEIRSYIPYSDAEFVERYHSALRKAGLPE